MELTKTISILLVLVIFILLTISKFKHTGSIQEDFFDNPSPSPNDTLQSEDTTNNPSPAPAPIDLASELDEALTGTDCTLYEDLPFPMDSEGNIDYNDLGLSNCYLQQDLIKILQRQIGNINPKFKYEDKKLIILIDSFDYNNLTSEIKDKIQNEIKQSVYVFMNQKYKKFKKQDFNIRPNDIKITAFSGSTYIIIEIIPRNSNQGLSSNDREILEFYNFKNILDGKKPISSIDFLYNTYINNQDIGDIISSGDISKLQNQLNTLHLLLLEQNRKSAIHTHSSSTQNSSPIPSPSPSNTSLSPISSSPIDSSLGPVSSSPNPSPSNNRLAPVSSSPNPAPSSTSLGPVSSSPNPAPSSTSLGPVSSSPNPSPSNTPSLFSPQPSPSS